MYHSLEELQAEDWFQPLAKPVKDLLQQGLVMWLRERKQQPMDEYIVDFSYLLFPLAKAYEGQLKIFLLKLGLIDKKLFEHKHFRIGRALNPDIRKSQQDEHWAFDEVAAFCGQEEARSLWETWLSARNRVFHYFPGERKELPFEEIEELMELVFESFQRMHYCVEKQSIKENYDR